MYILLAGIVSLVCFVASSYFAGETLRCYKEHKYFSFGCNLVLFIASLKAIL